MLSSENRERLECGPRAMGKELAVSQLPTRTVNTQGLWSCVHTEEMTRAFVPTGEYRRKVLMLSARRSVAPTPHLLWDGGRKQFRPMEWTPWHQKARASKIQPGGCGPSLTLWSHWRGC